MKVGWDTEPVKVACDPVKAGAELVPAGVNTAVPFVPTGVKFAVPFVPAGVNAAVPLVPEGVKEAVLLVPVAVVVWVCVLKAEPVNVSAGTVRFGAVALHAVVEPVPAAIFVVAQLPDVVVAPLVPAGVPALTALDMIALPVNV